jgi:hypothetical protein
MRIPGTTFTDDAPLPGSKAERIQTLEDAIRRYRETLVKESSYTHWNKDQQRVFDLALKWFDEAMQEAMDAKRGLLR